VHFDIYEVHAQTNVLFIKLGKVLKYTLKSLRIAPTFISVINQLDAQNFCLQ